MGILQSSSFLLCALLLSGCLRLGFDRTSRTDAPPGDSGALEGPSTADGGPLPDGLKLPEEIDVQPLAGALLGLRWNDYVKTKPGSDGSRVPTTIACDATVAKSYEDCVHAGELRRVELVGIASCQGLTLEDNLGAFDWACVKTATGVHFESQGLRPKRGLKDLVTASGWKPMHVTLHLGSSSVSSTPSVWWTNKVLPVPPGTGVLKLDQQGAVYVLDATRKAAGIDVLADEVAVVTLPGTRFEADAAAPKRCADLSWSGQPTTVQCLIAAQNRSQIWVEVSYQSLVSLSMYVVFFDGVRMSVARNIDAGTTEHGAAVRLIGSTANRVNDVFGRRSDDGEVTLRASHHNRVEEVTSLNGYSATLVLDSSTFNRMTTIRALNDDGTSVDLVDSDDNLLEDLQIVYAEGDSVSLKSSHRNRIVGLRSMDADGSALSLDASNDNVITDFRSAGNTVVIKDAANNTLTDGIISGSTWPKYPSSANFLYLSGAKGTTVAFVTLTNLAGTGILGNSATNTTLHKVVVANTAGPGLHFKESSGLHCSDLAIAHTDGNAVQLETVASAAFNGLITLCGNCLVSAPQQTGIQNGTCTLAAPSTGTLQRNLSLGGSFQAKVTVDDTTNPVDANGAGKLSYTWKLPATGFESYFAFENPFRLWGGDGQAFPHATNRESCRPAASCRIWDFRLAAGDKVLRDAAATQFPSAAPAPGKPCPAPLSGDRTVQNRFLSHALELRGDGRGDDDGLCETGEACLYAPNTGAYQGESALAKGCVFQDGAISGVEIHWHTQNGVP
jgi:hypothetical protein